MGKIDKSNLEDIVQLSTQQLGFLFHYMNDPAGYHYHAQVRIELTGTLDLGALQRAFELVVENNESLRSVFRWEKLDNPVQIILRKGSARLMVLSAADGAACSAQELAALGKGLWRDAFDLEETPFRAAVVRGPEGRFELLINHHHILYDGWSTGIILKELFSNYTALARGESPALRPKLKLRDHYLAEKKKRVSAGDAAAYWRGYLHGYEVKYLAQGPAESDDRRQRTLLSLDGKAIQTFCAARRSTVSSLFYTVLGMALQRYQNTDDVVFGTTVSIRSTAAAVDEIVGLFINTIPFRVRADDDCSVADLLSAVNDELIRRREHEYAAEKEIKNSIGYQEEGALFDAIMVVENYPLDRGLLREADGLRISAYSALGYAHYPLTVLVSFAEDSIDVEFDFDTGKLGAVFIRDFAGHFRQLLGEVLNHPEKKVRDCALLLPEERGRLLAASTHGAVAYPRDETIAALFAAQVERTPEEIAVVYEGRALSYRELNERANRLADYLRSSCGVRRGEVVCLCLDRSELLLVALLGVLKAGGAYVPMDPGYPADRIGYMLGDTGSRVVLTNAGYAAKLEQSATAGRTAIVCIDTDAFRSELSSYPSQDPVARGEADDLAYVIYTSGTTGRPKGVMITGRALVEYVYGVRAATNIDACKTFALVQPMVFDSAATVIYSSLLTGGELHIFSEQDVRDPWKMAGVKVDCLKIVPSHWRALQEGGRPFVPDKCLLLGGEALGADTIDELRRLRVGCEVYNHYGPTEATVGKLLRRIDPDVPGAQLSLGYPIGNARVYILDSRHRLLPVGATGEICIGGEGLAQGYLNLPELTKEKFIADPFRDGERIYTTGDLGRWLDDGSIAFIGRKDGQVKIRGYRIELGEIESKLLQYPGIGQAVVTVREQQPGGNKYVAGYYVSAQEVDVVALREFLSAALPEYMLPAALMRIGALPLMLNGKLDRGALPDPAFTDGGRYRAPENETEALLCVIYSEVLGLEPHTVGVEDDFFQLGGDSIVSIRLVSRIRQQLGINVSVRDIFQYRTIAQLYKAVAGRRAEGVDSIASEQGVLEGEVRLLPIQELFFRRLEKGLLPAFDHYNQSFLIAVPELDFGLLTLSIGKLVSYHDAFRLSYTREGGVRQSFRRTAAPITVHYLDKKTLGGEEQLSAVFTGWQSDFDIFGDKLFQAGYVEGYGDGRARVFFALHHLLVDVVSWRIIAEDLRSIYTYLSNNGSADMDAAVILGKKGSSYRQWTDTVAAYKAGDDTREEERSSWEALTAGAHLCNKLLSAQATAVIHRADIELDKQQTNQLLRESGWVYGTQINDLLLSALGMALSGLTGRADHFVLLEGHGREAIADELDVSRTVGWFTTLYPVELRCGGADIGEVLVSVKEGLRRIPHNGIGFGALAGYAEESLPPIGFNYLGQFDGGTGREGVTWFLTDEDSGSPVSPANGDTLLLRINGWVIGGQLHVSLAGRLPAGWVEDLAGLYERKLKELAAYLGAQQRGYLTPSDIGYLLTAEQLGKLQAERELEGVYAANSLQQGFIYHALHQGEVDDAYRVQLVWEYRSRVRVDLLKAAWESAQKKFGALRLRFGWEEELVQVIDKKRELDWRYRHIGDKGPEEQEKWIGTLLQADRQEAYNLYAGRLWRVYLVKQKEDRYTCVFSHHHAIMDGWSNPVLLGYVHTVYIKLLHGEAIKEEADLSYGMAQRYLQDHRGDNEPFWERYIGQLGVKEDLSGLLKTDKRHVDLSEYRHIMEPAQRELIIKGPSYERLKELCREQGFTVNAVLQYLWHKELSLYGAAEKTVVGMTVSGRNLGIAGIEDSVGLYINTLPVIVEHQPGRVVERIKALQDQINEINSRSEVSLSSLQKGSGRLFNSLFVYENYPMPVYWGTMGELAIVFRGAMEKSDYPLGVMAYERDEQVLFRLKYAGELFSEQRIVQLLVGFSHLLEQLLTDVSIDADCLRNVSETVAKERLSNGNAVAYPRDETIAALFAAQVERTPEEIAVVYEGRALSYRELNERANRLADYLRSSCGVRRGELVCLCLDRSELLLVALLGVLKAGGAYVPMDPGYPADRIGYMLGDTGSRVVLTNAGYAAKLEQSATAGRTAIVCIDTDAFRSELSSYPSQDPVARGEADDLAYVIYTSGTTGRPKGVMITGRALVEYVYGVRAATNIDACKTFALVQPMVFDSVATVIYSSLLTGGELHIFSEQDVRDPWKMAGVKVDCLKIVPSHWRALQEGGRPFVPDKCLLLGGEALGADTIDELRRLRVGCEVYNHYGPTEATVGKLLRRIDPDVPGAQLSLGYPIGNARVYILDSRHRLLPVGATGEICIGGEGLAQGYLNLPELTKEKFIADPFRDGERIYTTGDLGRWLDDGSIAFIGRKDGQVKIRGYRIELGEIESKLLQYPGIGQAVVTVREQQPGGNKYVAGYYVSAQEVDVVALREFLSAALPEYMLPAALMRIGALPLMLNGKLDRGALPDPAFTDGGRYRAPENETEALLCVIYGEVLGLEPHTVGVEDDFFQLGGNSIMAIRLAGKINSRLRTPVSVTAIFSHRTIRRLSVHLFSAAGGRVRISAPAVADAEKQVLSFAQERLWFIQTYEGGTNAYNVPIVLKSRGAVNMESIIRALRTIVSRHEVLRSLIKATPEGIGYQWVADDTVMPLPVERVTLWSYAALQESITASVGHIFRLDREYPIRVKIHSMREGEDEVHYLSIVLHHIAFDGWSKAILLRELAGYYRYHEALRGGNEADAVAFRLAGPEVQYKEYALWQRSYLTGEVLDRQLSYWREKLSGYEALNLPTDMVRPAHIDYAGRFEYFELGNEMSAGLREVAKQKGVSLYSVLLSAYYLFLSAYSNQKDIIVGTPVANRLHREAEEMIGFFVNTLVIRQRVDPEEELGQFIGKVGEATIEAQLHQELPFEKLVEALQVIQDASRHPLFQVVFGMQQFGSKEREALSPLFEFCGEEDGYGISKFDLTTMMDDSGENIKGVFNYATGLFREETIRCYVAAYRQVLAQVVVIAGGRKTARIRDLEIALPWEKERLAYTFNATTREYRRDQTIHGSFEEQVLRGPDRVAVRCDDKQITYAALNDQADRLATLLADQEIGTGRYIPLIMDRSIEMVVALLGVLKSGNAYIPIEPQLPAERILSILGSVDYPLLLTATSRIDKIRPILPKDRPELCVTDGLAAYSGRRPAPAVGALSDAYVIFTSGSTGRPKGVLVKHRPVINLIEWVNSRYAVDEKENLLFTASYSFDLSVYDIFGTLAAGGCIQVATDQDVRDPAKLIDMLIKNDISFWDSVPGVFQQLVPFLGRARQWKTRPGLRIAFLSGDWIPLTLPDDIKKYFPRVKVIGLGGATEATIWSNYFEIAGIDPEWKSIPYGRPIQNARYYILNDALKVCPVNVPGNLYIGGECLATGYLNDGKLTADKFIDSPFVSGEKLYKTGDLAKWRTDGFMEFLGRKDFQVKIRGYRIELGDIEYNLREHPKVKEAFILDRVDRDGAKYLCAYLVPRERTEMQELRDFLKERLPAYMIPAFFVEMDSIPLTSNGKINRGAFPDPNTLQHDLVICEEPVTESESLLREVWEQILDYRPIARTDNFFSIGGDSIKSIQVSSRLFNKGYRIGVAEIFANPVLSELASLIGEMDRTLPPPVILPVPERTDEAEELLPLSPVQQGIYYSYLLNKKDQSHFIQHSFRSRDYIDIGKLERTLQLIHDRHSILRANVAEDESGRPFLKIAVRRKIDLRHYTLTPGDNFEEKIGDHRHKDRLQPFDLAADNLFRFTVIENAADDWEMILSHQEIILDGWSLYLLFGEILEIYQELSGGREPRMAAAPSTRDYIQWLAGKDMDASRAYWMNYLSGYRPAIAISDYKGNGQGEDRIGNLSFELEKDKYDGLVGYSSAHAVTLNLIVQTVWGAILCNYFGVDDVVYAIGVSLRPGDIGRVEAMVGQLFNVVPFRVSYSSGESFTAVLERVKKQFFEGWPHFYYPLSQVKADNRYVKTVFDHSLVFNNFPKHIDDALSVMKIEGAQAHGFSNNALDIQFVLTDTLRIDLRFKESHHDRQKLERWLAEFELSFDRFLAEERILFKDVVQTPVAGRKRLINKFNEQL